MQTNSEIVAELKRVAISGELGSASAERLEEYSAALCNPATWELSGDGQFSQVCEAVRVHLLRAHIRNLQTHVVELHDHITDLDDKSTTLSWLVIVLTVASLFGAGGQIWYAYKADKKSEQTSPPVAASLQTSPAPQAVPFPAVVITSGQPIKKAP